MASLARQRLKEISVVRFDRPRYAAPINTSTAEFKLWLKWVMASAIGGIGGEVLALSVGAEASLTAFVLVSATAAAGQWLLLKRYLPKVRWWVTLSAIGGGIGAFFVLMIGLVIGLSLAILIANTTIFDQLTSEHPMLGVTAMIATLIVASIAQGALVGLFQWMILRGKVRRAELWIAASALGALVAGIVTAITPSLANMDTVTFAIVNTGTSQGISAAVTGIALVRLLELRISRWQPNIGHFVKQQRP